MSPEIMEDLNNTTDPVQPDPLLKPGSFIDPNPHTPSNGPSNSKPTPEKRYGSSSADVTDPANRPDWLPDGWIFKETLRTSGASAGTRDKYFIEPVTNRRFRSKKEVISYLETGTPPKPKRKSAESSADNKARANSETPKRKKSEAKVKVAVQTFNWDDVPNSVKWELTDIYEGSFRPLCNGVDRVPESAKQEWAAAFTYLAMQTGGRGTF